MKKSVNLKSLMLALIIFIVLLLIPIFNNTKAQQVFALLILVAILWITEAIPLPLTSLMIPVIAIFQKLITPAEGFREFANPIIFLFMGGFVLAGALSRHSLDKMLAQKLISLARGNFYWSSIFLMLATSLIACWVSNTSSVAMMLPLALGMLVLLKNKAATAEAKFLILGIAYSANIGGIITMTSSPPNAIGAAILKITFSGWLKYSLPIFLVTFPLMILLLTLYFKPDKKLSVGDIAIDNEPGTPTKTLAAIFIFTVVLWVLDGVLSPLLNISGNFNSLVALMAIFLLFVTRILTWDEIIKSIQWDILMLFGGGLTLGMLIENSGLGAIMVSHVAGLVNVVSMIVFLWMVVIFSIILTEFMSNTASAAMILPLLFVLANQLKINPVILVLPATIAASYGFMMPAGTPPNAMVFSTGIIPRKDMFMAGLMLNITFSMILTLFFYLIFL